jgi:cytochrome c oxidase subunit 1
MSAITPNLAGEVHGNNSAGDNYINHQKGFMSWAFTLDHKRIAIMYMVGVLSAFALGGFFAIMLRTSLLHPVAHAGQTPIFSDSKVVAWNFYNQMFTLHGAIMVFMFIIPAIPGILGNLVLPLMLGAKDVAFPRLNLLSFYCWLGGALFFAYNLFGGVLNVVAPDFVTAAKLHGIGFLIQTGLDTGWTFYTPFSSSKANGGVVPATLGAFILGFSSILTAVNFMATIQMLRPKKMGWFDMPLFLWAIYGTSLIQILATPVLAITLLLLCIERVLGIGIFDPKYGGDPILYQHFFWFYSHPAVYIMILPAMGVISELIGVHSRKYVFGYSFICVSSVAIALLGFIVWGHHMFVSGQSPLANAVFSLLTFAIAIPSAIKTFNWVATLYKGDIRLNTPMCYALGFIILFTVGGLTGLYLGAVATDVHLSATYFIVAHFHYVAVGSMLFALLGGIYHWWPKMFGKMFDDKVGRIACAILFVGFNTTFFVQFIAGSLGMPRRYANYPEKFQIFHQISTCGAYIMTIGLLLVLYNLVHSLLRGRPAPANPWGGNSLEWHCPSPPPHDNFPVTPEPTDPYDFSGWEEHPETGEWTQIPPERRVATPAH